MIHPAKYSVRVLVGGQLCDLALAGAVEEFLQGRGAFKRTLAQPGSSLAQCLSAAPLSSGMQLLGLELQQPTLEQKERAWLFSDGRGRFALSQGKN